MKTFLITIILVAILSAEAFIFVKVASGQAMSNSPSSVTVTPLTGIVPFTATVAITNGWLYTVSTNGLPWLKQQWGVFKLPINTASNVIISVSWQALENGALSNLPPITITALPNNVVIEPLPVATNCLPCVASTNFYLPSSVTITNPPFCPTNAPVTLTNVTYGSLPFWTTNGGVEKNFYQATNFPPGYLQGWGTP